MSILPPLAPQQDPTEGDVHPHREGQATPPDRARSEMGTVEAGTIVDALDRMKGVHARGFTFLDGKGPGQDLVLSFDALRRAAIERAHHLERLGLRKGDRLAMVVPRGQDFVPIFFGALWAGIVPVPLYPPASLGQLDAFMEALAGILESARPRALVTGDGLGKILWSLAGRVRSLERSVTVAELAAAAPEASEERVPAAPTDLAFLQFTSGSTTTPKGVRVTHGSLVANAKAIIFDGLRADGRKGDVAVSWLPLYHDMGLIGFVLSPLITQVPVVFIPTLSFVKNATLWLETIHRYRGTLTFAPNFAYALAAKRARRDQIARWDLSCMRVFGCGAEPINPDTLRAFTRVFAPSGLKPEALLPCYGMAEATLAMSFASLAEPMRTEVIDADCYQRDRKARPLVPKDRADDANGRGGRGNGAQTAARGLEIVSCGRPFPEHELSIRDANGRAQPDRTVGEIWFKGPSVAAGYWENPEASKAAGMGPEGVGWLRTGDLGYLVDGELFVSGRLKDILIVHGRNYDPQRIEWAVEKVPGTRKGSAVAFSRPGREGEEIVVVVESREPDRAALARAIAAKVSEELQLAVAEVCILEPGVLPKTSSGKLQRRKTREQYLNGALGKVGRNRGAGGRRLLVAKYLTYSLWGRARHEARNLFFRVLPIPSRER